MTLVFNASPLIVLAKAGLIDRLLPLAESVWIPQAVADEVRGIKSPALDAVVTAGLFVANHHLEAIRIAAGE